MLDSSTYLTIMLVVGALTAGRVNIRGPWLPNSKVTVYKTAKDQPECSFYLNVNAWSASEGQKRVLIDSVTMDYMGADSIPVKQTRSFNNDANGEGVWFHEVPTNRKLFVTLYAEGYAPSIYKYQDFQIWKPSKLTKQRVSFNLLATQLHSATVEWQAFVQDASTAMPVENANVRLVHANDDPTPIRESQTNDFGETTLDLVRFQLNRIEVKHPDYVAWYGAKSPGKEPTVDTQPIRLWPKVIFPTIPFDGDLSSNENKVAIHSRDSLNAAIAIAKGLKHGYLGVRAFPSDLPNHELKAMETQIVDLIEPYLHSSMRIRRSRSVLPYAVLPPDLGYKGVQIFAIGFDSE